MELITGFFNEILFRPIFNLLVWTYDTIPGHDFGVSIILVTVLLRFLLYPFSDKALKSQKKLQDLQPQIKELQKKCKTKEEQAKAVMEFYKAHQVNPLSGCLPILIQLPILIALYKVFLIGLEPQSLDMLYPFVYNPGEINPMFLGIMDMSKPSWILAVFAGLAQFVQAKTAMPNSASSSSAGSTDFAKSMGQSMIYMMPLFMVFISWKMPAGLPLYWVVTMLFSFAQQLVVYKNNNLNLWRTRKS